MNKLVSELAAGISSSFPFSLFSALYCKLILDHVPGALWCETLIQCGHPMKESVSAVVAVKITEAGMRLWVGTAGAKPRGHFRVSWQMETWERQWGDSLWQTPALKTVSTSAQDIMTPLTDLVQFSKYDHLTPHYVWINFPVTSGGYKLVWHLTLRYATFCHKYEKVTELL